jgi:hypothetical protein
MLTDREKNLLKGDASFDQLNESLIDFANSNRDEFKGFVTKMQVATLTKDPLIIATMTPIELEMFLKMAYFGTFSLIKQIIGR